MRKLQRPILCFLLLTCLATVVGQNQKKIEGTWKVIVMSDDEMYYDIKKDSLSIPGATDKDSAVVKSFINMFAELRDYLYVFQKGGKYQELSGGKIDSEGEYTVDTKNSVIIMKGKRNGVNYTERMKYRFKDELLIMIEENAIGPKLTLEKQK